MHVWTYTGEQISRETHNTMTSDHDMLDLLGRSVWGTHIGITIYVRGDTLHGEHISL